MPIIYTQFYETLSVLTSVILISVNYMTLVAHYKASDEGTLNIDLLENAFTVHSIRRKALLIHVAMQSSIYTFTFVSYRQMYYAQ